MRPALPPNTVLQNRYRLLSILGQGGFGRTYLGEDQSRFNELCALKELIPSQTGGYALDKSKELFQREAQILYQIQHPQIPQFRATFEEDQRFFIIQDYVEGSTYRALQDQRRSQGYAFSEGEVMQLLWQLLPVLAHIHSKGLIHRDIAPDNIILRDRDRLPVLIDFGVVKELVTRIQSPQTAQQTTVGKLGYAPSEQLQTGRAYPNSDLYALAVTAVVLLTGKEPNELYDETTLTWYWQRWVTVSPGFAAVLDRMLSYRPSERYQSCADVIQALQAAAALPLNSPPSGVPSSTPSGSPMPPAATMPPAQELSQVKTMAVGRRPEPLAASSQGGRGGASISPPRRSLSDDPWSMALIGTGLVVLTGIGSWALVRSIMNVNQNPLPTVSPSVSDSPSPSPTASATPTPTPTVEPVNFSKKISLIPGAKSTQTGSLKANESITYIFSGEQGQQLKAFISGEGMLMSFLGPNREAVDAQSKRVSLWQGELPYTGNYYIQLSPVKGLNKSDYQLDLTLSNPVQPSPSPSPSPTSAPPDGGSGRITIPGGTGSTAVQGQATADATRRYVVSVAQGQMLKVSVDGNGTTLDIRYPDGQVVDDASGRLSYEGRLPRGGDYIIDVVGSRAALFTLNVTVEN
jgi:serine/threonine protein kinase